MIKENSFHKAGIKGTVCYQCMRTTCISLHKCIRSSFWMHLFLSVFKNRDFFSFLNLISSIAKFKLDFHNNGINIFKGFHYPLNHNLLTSKIPKKERLCQKIGPHYITILFFQNDVAILIPSPRFCMQKTIKSISWISYTSLWLFLRIKNNDDFFSSGSG